MTEPIRKGYVCRVDAASEADRTVTAIITTDAVDAFKEVVVPSGLDLAKYRSNPVVLWNHNQDPAEGTVPIGKNLWIKPDGARLVAKTKFAGDERGERFFRLYADEVLRAWSVGFNEVKGANGPPTSAELRTRADWSGARRVYRRGVLFEYSGVPVGANPEALTVAVRRGLWLPATLAAQVPEPEPAPELPAFVGRGFDEVLRSRLARIRAAGAALAADELDRLRGRV